MVVAELFNKLRFWPSYFVALKIFAAVLVLNVACEASVKFCAFNKLVKFIGDPPMNANRGQFVRLVPFVKLTFPEAVTIVPATAGLGDSDNVMFGPNIGWASLKANAVRFPNENSNVCFPDVRTLLVSVAVWLQV